MTFIVDIEVYDKPGESVWAQAKYCVHGASDVLWTNDLDEAVEFLKQSIKEKLCLQTT